MFHTTIIAIATALVPSGVGVVRLSGNAAPSIAQAMTRKALPSPRHAALTDFYDGAELIDRGLLLYFPSPHSFTGEEVVEMQIHGSPQALSHLVRTAINHGAVMAGAGEFTRRAFLNGKMDLYTAEALAELIHARTRKAAHYAARSLTGGFSQTVAKISQSLIELRSLWEAGLDFADEDIELLSLSSLQSRLQTMIEEIAHAVVGAKMGVLLQEGVRCVITGAPNVGKSSLFNVLAEEEIAIVTDIAGTTRDVLSRTLAIDGVPFEMLDTAGLRASLDPVEQIGIERAWQAVQSADLLIHLTAVTTEGNLPDFADLDAQVQKALTLARNQSIPIIQVINKADQLTNKMPQLSEKALLISAKNRWGLEELKKTMLAQVGWQEHEETLFIARKRHLLALESSLASLRTALQQAQSENAEATLIAEDLRLAHRALQSITGEFTTEDLLGEIFGRFCIGK